MATLAAISFTLVGGIAAFGISITAFGCAVKSQSMYVAARCIARPLNVIYNPHPKHPCQNRGNPTLGWIMWVMRLRYDTMLRGVPGTGTRDGGLSGALLKVNLDGIVLLRFHHLCLRICFLALLLYIVIVLPLYKTAQCSRIQLQQNHDNLQEESFIASGGLTYNYNTDDQTQQLLYCHTSNLTDYQRLTLANIPALDPPPTDEFGDILKSFFLPVHDGLLARLYAVVICAWIVSWYALRELQYEWSEVLAMRRVYYLEADHWVDRNEELQETLLREKHEKLKRQKKALAKQSQLRHHHQQQHQADESYDFNDEYEDYDDSDNDDESTSSSTEDASDDSEQDDDMYMKNREPWACHPEQRDTVPNVELYSILVGGLPSLPTEVVQKNTLDGGGEDQELDAVLFSRKQSIDWQLTVTTAFFDHCVPNQPGFSSSVAAVTILPAADQLTEAWDHWYRAAAKLRRLRFIRKQIGQKRKQKRFAEGNSLAKFDNNDDEDQIDYQDTAYDIERPIDNNAGTAYSAKQKKRNQLIRRHNNETDKTRKRKNSKKRKGSSKTQTERTVPVYPDSEEIQKQYHDLLGSNTDLDVENNLLHALHFGPEQTAVYSREFALASGNVAPNGWFEDKIRKASLPELLEMEKTAMEAVHEANYALKQACGKIADNDDLADYADTRSDHEVKSVLSDNDLEQIIKNSTTNGSGHLDFIAGSQHGLRSIGSSNTIDRKIRDSDDSMSNESGHNQNSMDMPLKGSTAPTNKRRERLTGRSSPNNLSTGRLSRSSSFASLARSNESSSCNSFAEDSDVDLEDYEISIELTAAEKRKESAVGGLRRSSSNDNKSENNNGGIGTSRFSLADVGKQMSMQLLPMVSTLSMGTSLRTHSSGGNRPPRRRAKRADITTTQLPSDLGLEAGLFMEQRNLSLAGGSQHVSRRQVRRQMSGDSADALPRKSRRPPRRTKSEDDFDTDDSGEFPASTPLPTSTGGIPRRTKSFDDLEDIEESNNASPTNSPHSTSLSIMQESLKEKKKVDVALKSPSRAATIESGGRSPSSIKSPGSIWDRIEKDKERKTRLREKLGSMQKLQNTPSTQSGNGRSITQDGLELPSRNEDVGASSTSQLKASARRFDNASENRDLHPPMKTQRSWRSDREKTYQSDASNTSRTGSDIHVATSSVDGKLMPAFESDKSQLSHGWPCVRKASSFVVGSNHMMSAIDENDSVAETSMAHLPPNVYPRRHIQLDTSRRSMSSHSIIDDTIRFEEEAGIREREGAGPRRRLNNSDAIDNKWAKVVAIVKDDDKDGERKKGRKIHSGKWKVLGPKKIIWKIYQTIVKIISKSFDIFKKPDVINDLAEHSSYAVVTFTSRQAAVAARHCLADSRGADRWVTVGEIPSPPLADAPAFNLAGRGMARPVTLTISEKQKLLRHYLALAVLATIFFFYTIPLTAAQQLVSPETLSRVIPDILVWQENSSFVENLFSGIIPALVWTGFIAICPPMFKIIANFGSNATSLTTAENSALNYFWWFMVVTAFTGTSLSTAIVNGFNEGIAIGQQFQVVVEQTASSIPTEVSATWLNWMIVRVTMVLPTQYLLQLNTFLLASFRMKPCTRAVRGGGSGGPIPYRIYVDSGCVMLCVFALAPASPLISAAAFLYFLFAVPMLRWTLIFLYKPKFDIGGQRFPFLCDMFFSGIFVGQVLLVAMMTLKRAIGPAIVAFCPMIPTLLYRWVLRRRYLRAFSDAALLQTSLLDGWDTNQDTNEPKREEFRRFLVDCHKAAYVPVCIASSDTTTSITVEPAIVVPTEADVDEDYTEGEYHYMETGESVAGGGESQVSRANQSLPSRASTGQQQQQHGGFARRAQSVLPAHQRRVPSTGDDRGQPSDLSTSSPQRQPQPGQMLRRMSLTSPVQGAKKGFGHNKYGFGLDVFDVSERSGASAAYAAGQRRIGGNLPVIVSPFGSPNSTPAASPKRKIQKKPTKRPERPPL